MLSNLIAQDAQRLVELCAIGHRIVVAPFVVLAGIIYIFYLIGWPVFAGVLIMLLFVPVGKKISGRMQQL